MLFSAAAQSLSAASRVTNVSATRSLEPGWTVMKAASSNGAITSALRSAVLVTPCSLSSRATLSPCAQQWMNGTQAHEVRFKSYPMARKQERGLAGIADACIPYMGSAHHFRPLRSK
jgi:hypothetical protein